MNMTRTTHTYNTTIHDVIIIIHSTINPIFLPFGLYYTHIYAPIGLYYISQWSAKAVVFLLFLISLAALYSSIVLLTHEVRYYDYILGFVVLLAGLAFSVYIYLYLALRVQDFENLVEKIININLIFCAIALTLMIFKIDNTLWTTSGPSEKANRLQMFFYEPSVYSLVYAPFLTYRITSYLEQQKVRGLFLLFIALTPLVLSGSAGVIGALFLAIIVLSLPTLMKLFITKALIVIPLFSALVFFIPDLITRYDLIVKGQDHSGSVRVLYSLMAASNMLNEKDMWLLGVGPGQIKYLVSNYTSEIRGFVGDRLPNSVASSIATIGIIGTLLKFSISMVLYVTTKSYHYKYSNTLVLFLFIYQFTGGYFSNINEYVIMAFSFGYARYRQRMNTTQRFIAISPHY